MLIHHVLNQLIHSTDPIADIFFGKLGKSPSTIQLYLSRDSDRSRAVIIRAQQRDLHFRARSHCLGYPSYSSTISPLPVHIHIWTLIRPVGSSIESVPTSQFSSRSESSRRGPQMTESLDSRCRAPRSIHKWVSAFHETDVPDPRPYFRSQSFFYKVQ